MTNDHTSINPITPNVSSGGETRTNSITSSVPQEGVWALRRAKDVKSL